MKEENSSTKMTAIPGPWVAEATVCAEEGGLAVIAINPDVPVGGTPTRGMVAWVNNRHGACDTEAMVRAIEEAGVKYV